MKTRTQPKFPKVHVTLMGGDGNAFSILAKCRRAAQRGGVSQKDIDEFTNEAMAGDYDHLLQTCMQYFEVS